MPSRGSCETETMGAQLEDVVVVVHGILLATLTMIRHRASLTRFYPRPGGC